MLVANLTRYDQDRDCDCGQTCMSGMCEYPDGEYVKFEEAAEASSNSLQQLNVAIALWREALDAHRGQNVDAWFWGNIDRVNAVIAQHATI